MQTGENHFLDRLLEKVGQSQAEYLSTVPGLPLQLGKIFEAILANKPKKVEQFCTRVFGPARKYMSIEKSSPLLLVGPSGTGKDTLANKLREAYPDVFEFSVSYTTRGARPGEVHGKDYFFASQEDFEARVQQNDFVEHVTYAGNRYGTSKSFLHSIEKKGKVTRTHADLSLGHRYRRS